jgi:hypothetical protein
MLHFDLQFDDSVGSIRTIIEQAVRSSCERDFNTIEGVFPPFVANQARKITLHVGLDCPMRAGPETVGVATYQDCSETIFQCVAPRNDSDLPLSLQTFCASVAALAVQLFGSSLLSWTNKSCLGQSLCLSIARDFYPAAIDLFEPLEQAWYYASPLYDYINEVPPDAQNLAANGCVMLFFSFLRQMGFGWHQIILAGLPFDSNPRDIYRGLTGNVVDPFPLFQRQILGEISMSK